MHAVSVEVIDTDFAEFTDHKDGTNLGKGGRGVGGVGRLRVRMNFELLW